MNKPIYTKDHPTTIKALFNHIASGYDKTNIAISFTLSKRWNTKIAACALKNSPPSFTMLDLCSGTGDVAFACLKKAPKSSTAILLDFSSEMLNIAKDKATKLPFDQHSLKYIEADAQEIPLATNSIDFSTIAYGVRNIHDLSQCFQEVHRVLKVGGGLAILELTRPTNPLLKFGHKIYLKFLPLIGKIFTKDKQAYEYLCRSIHAFSSPAEIEKLLRAKNFEAIQQIPLMGGIATIIVARKK